MCDLNYDLYAKLDTLESFQVAPNGLSITHGKSNPPKAYGIDKSPAPFHIHHLLSSGAHTTHSRQSQENES